MPSKKHCDYCGEIIFIGDQYFAHNDLLICTDCARNYAWSVFEEQAVLRYSQPDQLLNLDIDKYDY